jgi:lipoprotein-releasing system permease protein
MPSNFGGGPGGGSAMDQSQSDTYQIPGLVIEISETDSSISGIYGDSGVLDDSAKTGETISIQIDSIKHREDVVKELNKQGFAFQDLSDLDVLARVQSTLDQTSKGLIIAFIVISSGVVILTMSKFVSESTREIGIFRAVGFTKKNILSIFLLQGIIYTAVGYILGMILGGLGNILISPVVFKWFQSFVDGTVKQTVNVTGEVDASIFRSFDIGTIVLLSALLMAITIILSYIPSLKASNVSPVEAIKSE